MKTAINIVLSLLTVLITLPVFAVKEVDVFTQSVLVEKNATSSRVNEVRKQAMLQALRAVTLKKDIGNVAVIKTDLEKHKQYILSEKVRATDEVFVSVIGQEVTMIELVIRFDVKKINQLLLRANVSTLDAKRPEALAVILVQNKDGSTDILSREDLYIQPLRVDTEAHVTQPAREDRQEGLSDKNEGDLTLDALSTQPFYALVAQRLDQQAQSLSLPVIWPMMDYQDLYFFDQSNFWQVDKESILEFAKRYSAQLILVARIQEQDNGRFIGEWNVLDIGRPKVQYYDSLEVFTDVGLKQLAQTVMQQYGINPNDKKDEQVIVTINQVSTITSFHQNETFLNKLSGVQSARALNVNGYNVTYLVQLNVSQKQFLTNLDLNDSLTFQIEDELRRPVVLNVTINEI